MHSTSCRAPSNDRSGFRNQMNDIYTAGRLFLTKGHLHQNAGPVPRLLVPPPPRYNFFEVPTQTAQIAVLRVFNIIKHEIYFCHQ